MRRRSRRVQLDTEETGLRSGSARVRVGFDARALAFPAGGVRRYARELFSVLPALEPAIDFVAIDPPAGVDLPPGTIPGPTTLAVPTNLARSVVTLPAAIRRARVDLFHAPAYTAPLIGRAPVVLTIHDVSYARRPEFYPHAAGPARQWFYRRSATRASRIITDSEFSRSEIAAAYGIPPAGIAVVPLGVGAPFLVAGPDRAGADADLGAQGLPDGVRPPYVLHVGELHPRRDLPTALRAVIEVRRRGADRAGGLRLVCAGTDRGAADALRAAAREAMAPDSLSLLGAVPESDLVRLYRHATALVYPSLYEGFGLPVLEAMASGLPVVAARAGSVPEVVGDAGILFDAGDWQAAADALASILSDANRRGALGARGVERAGEFTWARVAQRTLAVYRDLLADAGHPAASAAS